MDTEKLSEEQLLSLAAELGLLTLAELGAEGGGEAKPTPPSANKLSAAVR